ncbi:MAG: hypothetical protein GXO50_00175, partial [Chlorobi bacterium]|nr:hypothetical protein [Chlorobiota bacterium]
MKTSIKRTVLYIPAVISFLLAAAHFSRINLNCLVIVSLLLPFILFFKKPLTVRIIQIALIIIASEWARSLFTYIGIKNLNGESWTRLALILSAVILFTLLST